MKTVYYLMLLFICIKVNACTTNTEQIKDTSKKNYKTDSMKLQITIGDKLASAILYDNPSAKDFASLLPLNLTLEDYNNTEKISTLSKKLISQGAPAGFDPHWHGASAQSKMTHIAITNYKGEQNVVWFQAVSDVEYKEANKH
jgi:hypothetical protein